MAALSSHVGWPLDEDAAAHVFTELLGNVIRHGESPVSLSLQCDGTSVKFRITESGRGFDQPIGLPPLSSEHGRGLFLVSQLADELSVAGDPHGTIIVATLRRDQRQLS